jgi:hypothetical protein
MMSSSTCVTLTQGMCPTRRVVVGPGCGPSGVLEQSPRAGLFLLPAHVRLATPLTEPCGVLDLDLHRRWRLSD